RSARTARVGYPACLPREQRARRGPGAGATQSDQRTSTGCFSLNVKAVSAGKTIDFLPVNAAPAVPAPAPAAAPMAAPLPPPDIPPKAAPTPAPPPIAIADRLPLPLVELPVAVVSM